MKKKIRLILTAAVTAAIVCALAIGLSGCGGAAEEESGPVINPITGLEATSDLPARPVIVSIDNVGEAKPQSNISAADIVYEFPVEGLQTRLEAVFYSEFPEFVGPIRSTRPYFVDLTREYKGIFVAYGWSPDAKRYLKTGVVPWINGMVDTDLYYRSSEKPAPHNAYIEWENIMTRADEKGWMDEPKKVRAFKFIGQDEEEDVDAEAAEGEEAEEPAIEPEDAEKLTVKYAFAGCEFTYDPETNTYARSVYGKPYIDKETGEQITVSNILVQRVSSEVLDEKGRLEIDMCEGGEAMLFTGGKVIKGTWSRKNLDRKTVFKDENGKQFRLTPGKSWVEVADQTCTLTY